MRITASLLCLVFVLSVAHPAQAQLRENSRNGSVPTQLYDTGESAADLLGQLFDANHFRMAHSYEMSFSSFGGQSSSLGMYTNTMMWQFNPQWAARVDVSVAHQMFGNAGFEDQNPRVFLRNAEVAYRPSENMEFRLQVQQSPYGRYASPYGYYGYNRYRSAFFTPMQTPTEDLFWRN